MCACACARLCVCVLPRCLLTCLSVPRSQFHVGDELTTAISPSVCSDDDGASIDDDVPIDDDAPIDEPPPPPLGPPGTWPPGVWPPSGYTYTSPYTGLSGTWL